MKSASNRSLAERALAPSSQKGLRYRFRRAQFERAETITAAAQTMGISRVHLSTVLNGTTPVALLMWARMEKYIRETPTPNPTRAA